MVCGCNKDQTSEDIFQYLKDLQSAGKLLGDERGVGLFMVPAPELGILEDKVVTVRDLTYSETSKRGENCIAFKWVPSSFKSFEDIEAERKKCGQYCGPRRDWCPGLCFCGRGNYCV